MIKKILITTLLFLFCMVSTSVVGQTTPILINQNGQVVKPVNGIISFNTIIITGASNTINTTSGTLFLSPANNIVNVNGNILASNYNAQGFTGTNQVTPYGYSATNQVPASAQVVWFATNTFVPGSGNFIKRYGYANFNSSGSSSEIMLTNNGYYFGSSLPAGTNQNFDIEVEYHYSGNSIVASGDQKFLLFQGTNGATQGIFDGAGQGTAYGQGKLTAGTPNANFIGWGIPFTPTNAAAITVHFFITETDYHTP